jgi:hypothetical protein
MSKLYRKTNKNVEIERLGKICYYMNNPTFIGFIMRQEYYKLFGKNINQVILSGGSNKDHYDIEIVHIDGTKKKCEEKSTIFFKQDLSRETKPWEYSVQVYNGIGKHFQIGILYAKLWYKHNIQNGVVKRNYNINSPIPTEAEWLKKDAFQCGNPKTLYGMELKQKFRKIHGETSMNGKSKEGYIENLVDYREPISMELKLMLSRNTEIKIGLINEIQQILNKIFTEKECYLQTTGDIDTENFNFLWYPQIQIPKILDLKLNEKNSDIVFDIVTDITQDYSMILRFGKGTGFSNIRIDIR